MHLLGYALVAAFVAMMYYMVIGLAYILWYTGVGIVMLCVFIYESITNRRK